MKRFLVFLLAFAMLATLCACSARAAGEDVELTIVHTNDVHGYVDVEPYTAALVKSLREDGKNVILISAGDALDGTSFANADSGLSMATVMGAVGYDCFVPGNHEQMIGLEATAAAVAVMGATPLAANAADGMRQALPTLQDYLLKTYDGVTVAFIGITTEGDNVSAGYIEALETARDNAAKEGATVFVAVTHVGNLEEDGSEKNTKEIARQCPWLSVILDAHDHVAYENGLRVGDVLIAETGESGNNIGVVTMDIAADGTVTAAADLISKEQYTAEITPDADVLALIEQFREEQAYLEETICTVPTAMDGERSTVRSFESNLGDTTCDAIIWASGVDFASVTGTYLRANVAQGDFTNADRLSTFLKEENITVSAVTGQQLWDMLEKDVTYYGQEASDFHQFGGVRIVFDPSKPQGQRLISVTMANGDALDMDKEYLYGSTTQRLSAGGASAETLAGDYGTVPQAFVDYMNSGEAGDCQPDGRFCAAVTLEPGETWLLDVSYRLSALTIAENAAIVSAEGGSVTLTVNGEAVDICPGVYEGDIELSIE